MDAAFRSLPARPQRSLEGTPFHAWTLPDGTPWTQFHRTDSGYLLRFPTLADFTLSPDGRDVTATPAPGVSQQTVEHLHLNQVLPLALSLQSRLVFHASAVDIDGVAVAFMGESGRGKSTLAASFATAGHPFLTDDGLLVEGSGAGYRIVPSHPSIRLWRDSEAALIAGGTPAAPALEFTSKSRFLAGDHIPFCDAPRPLQRVYFLGDDAAAATFHRLPPVDALVGLLRHSFLLDVEARDLLAGHFDELSALASQPIFFRLDYPRRYADLPAVRRAIVEHAQQNGHPPMNRTDSFRIPPHVMARRVGDETVILDLSGGTYFGLDPVGARVWQLIGEGRTLGEVCDTLLDEYAADRDQIEHDVTELAEKLLAQKLIAF